MMNVDGVEMAVRASLYKGLEPCEASGAAAVGDCGGAEGRFASEGLHVVLVDSRSALGAEVRLAGIIWFVGSGNIHY